MSSKGIKKSSGSGSIKSRSRNGCEICKKKRLRCDENHPSCSNCTKRGFKCNYKIVLQFKEDLEAKGVCFGREGVWVKHKSTKKPVVTSNDLSLIAKSQNYIKIDNLDRIEFINFSYNDLNFNNFIQPSLNSTFVPRDILLNVNRKMYQSDSQHLNFALTYYIYHISPILDPIKLENIKRLQNCSTSLNKGLEISSLVQYGQKHHHIFYLILGIGSFYLSRSAIDKHQREYWMGESVKYKQMALDHLKNKRNQNFTVDSLLAMMLICLYDLANNCEDTWIHQLKYFKNILNDHLEHIVVSDYFEQTIFDYVVQFFAYQEAMGRTACKDSNLFDSDFWDAETETTIIPWMGCNKRLIGIISDITDLSFERFNDDITNEKYLLLTEGMKQRLDLVKIENNNFEINLSELDEHEVSSLENECLTEEFCFLLLCEVKRLSTLIYLDCSLMNKSPGDLDIRRHVNRLIKYIRFILIDNNHKWSSLLWPIFIVAGEINPLDNNSEQLRQLILEFLNALEPHSLGNVNKTREIIINIWKKRDLMVDDNKFKINKFGKNLIGMVNDWETYISNKNYKISLA